MTARRHRGGIRGIGGDRLRTIRAFDCLTDCGADGTHPAIELIRRDAFACGDELPSCRIADHSLARSARFVLERRMSSNSDVVSAHESSVAPSHGGTPSHRGPSYRIHPRGFGDASGPRDARVHLVPRKRTDVFAMTRTLSPLPACDQLLRHAIRQGRVGMIGCFRWRAGDWRSKARSEPSGIAVSGQTLQTRSRDDSQQQQRGSAYRNTDVHQYDSSDSATCAALARIAGLDRRPISASRRSSATAAHRRSVPGQRAFIQEVITVRARLSRISGRS